VITIASIVPYLAVGKSTSLFWIDYWTGRHSLPLMPSIALLTGKFADHFFSSATYRVRYIIYPLSILMTIAPLSLLQARDMLDKYHHQQVRNAIKTELIKVRDDIDSGILRVQIKNTGQFALNGDESNLLAYEVFGDLKTYTLISSDVSPNSIPKEISSQTIPRLWNLFDKQRNNCVVSVVLAREISNPKNSFHSILSNSPRLIIESFQKKCT
jgi:hypothetical protein